jgi:hypothetical protein
MMMEAQEREELRKVYEFAKRREEEIKKGNRKMLLDMTIKGITEKPEKYKYNNIDVKLLVLKMVFFQLMVYGYLVQSWYFLTEFSCGVLQML